MRNPLIRHNRKISRTLLWGLIIGLACRTLIPVVNGDEQTNDLQIICTTSLLSSAAEAVGEDRIEVHTIIPFGMCPGHFDLTPGEVQKIRNANLLLCHGFEHFLKGVDMGKTEVVQTNVKGNWMIPDIHTQAVQWVLGVLTARRPELAVYFSKRAESYLHEIHAAKNNMRSEIIKHKNLPVICSSMNRDLVEWMGFTVIADYPRDEDVSVKTMHNITTKGQEMKIRLVIDNKQSGGKVGRTIAEELNIPFVLLSNFPETPSTNAGGYAYIQTLSNNFASVANPLPDLGEQP